LAPIPLDSITNYLLAAVTNEGRMLIFPIDKLPTLNKGKGNKIIHIPAKRAKERKELLTHLCVIHEDGALTVFAGKRFFKLTAGNLTQFVAERGRRGKKLPRGFQNVDRLESDAPAQTQLKLLSPKEAI